MKNSICSTETILSYLSTGRGERTGQGKSWEGSPRTSYRDTQALKSKPNPLRAIRDMRTGLLTSVLLVLSTLLGLAILGTDHNLWSLEPSHAYGLIGFVAVDVIAIALVMWKGSRMTLLLGGIWGALFALIMVSDIYSGGATAFSTTPDQFAIYLFGLGYYDTYHIAFLFPALFVVNILVAIVGYWESRRAMGMARTAGTAQPTA